MRMKSETPLISVIVPVYNVEPYVDRCLISLRAQTYPNIEILVVDDASTDGSGPVCDRHAAEDSRVRVMHLPANRGLSAARNEGAGQAKGEFAAFVDSDDYVEPDMLFRLYDSLRKSRADVSVCGCVGLDMRKAEARVFSDTETVYCLARRGPFLWNAWGKLFPMELVKRHRFHERAFYCEDLLFFYEILREIRKVSYVPRRLYHYEYREGSLINSGIGRKRCTVLALINGICRDARVNMPKALPGFLQIAMDTSVRLAMEAVEKGTKEGSIGGYLRVFQKNIRNHFTWRALFVNPDIKNVTGILALYVSQRLFFDIASACKGIRRLKEGRKKTV